MTGESNQMFISYRRAKHTAHTMTKERRVSSCTQHKSKIHQHSHIDSYGWVVSPNKLPRFQCHALTDLDKDKSDEETKSAEEEYEVEHFVDYQVDKVTVS